MTPTTNPRFEVRRLTSTEWVINDHWFPPGDPRHAVACVDEIRDDVVEVVWIRELWLPDRYCSIQQVIDDISRSLTTSTKPIPIPHRRPLPYDNAMTG